MKLKNIKSDFFINNRLIKIISIFCLTLNFLNAKDTTTIIESKSSRKTDHENSLTALTTQNSINSKILLLNSQLIMATNANNINAIEKLLASGADINTVLDGLSPLHLAITNADIILVEKLLKLGANPKNTILLNNINFDAIGLINWYKEIYKSFLAELEVLHEPTQDPILVEELSKEWAEKLNTYNELSILLNSYPPIN